MTMEQKEFETRVAQMEALDRGWGYALSERWTIALNANYFASTSDYHFGQFTASVDYRLR